MNGHTNKYAVFLGLAGSLLVVSANAGEPPCPQGTHPVTTETTRQASYEVNYGLGRVTDTTTVKDTERWCKRNPAPNDTKKTQSSSSPSSQPKK
jgi:hypothetical protein